LDVFKEWFKDYSDQYVLIGGTAAYLAMREFGLPFRGSYTRVWKNFLEFY
jgi:hypothetical protein